MAKEDEEYTEVDVNDADASDEEVDRGDFLGEDEVEEEDEEELEVSEEEEEESAEEEDIEEEAAEEESDEPITIPKPRFDEVYAQRSEFKEMYEESMAQNRELVAEMTKLMQNMAEPKETKEEPVPKFDYDSAEEALTEAYLEGDTARVRELRASIRAAQRAEILAEANKAKEEAVAAAKSEVKATDDARTLKSAIRSAEKKYPFLSKDAETPNQKAIDEVNDLFTAFAKSGMYTQGEALSKAVDLVAPKYSKGEATGLGEPTETRSKKSRVRNAKANKKQPPKMKGRTSKETTVDDLDPFKADLGKLSKRELKELRGDFV